MDSAWFGRRADGATTGLSAGNAVSPLRFHWLPKYGKSQGKQTYRCGQCLYHFTAGAERPHLAAAVKDRLVALYTAGASLAAISRVEGLKGATVYDVVQKSPGGRSFDATVGASAGELSARPG